MIRHEIISIHVAFKPQWYPECAHLNVAGEGNALPTEDWFYKFPGAYSEDGEPFFFYFLFFFIFLVVLFVPTFFPFPD